MKQTEMLTETPTSPPESEPIEAALSLAEDAGIEEILPISSTDLAAQLQAEVGENTDDHDYPNMAAQTVAAFQQIYQAGDQVALIMVNPELHAGYLAAFQALPDEVMPPELKQNLQILADPDTADIAIITGRDMEKRFLENYFGPEDVGGNGLIPRMLNYLQHQSYPVRITHEWLRNRYLDEIAARIEPGIIRPQMGLAVPPSVDLRKGRR